MGLRLIGCGSEIFEGKIRGFFLLWLSLWGCKSGDFYLRAFLFDFGRLICFENTQKFNLIYSYRIIENDLKFLNMNGMFG